MTTLLSIVDGRDGERVRAVEAFICLVINGSEVKGLLTWKRRVECRTGKVIYFIFRKVAVFKKSFISNFNFYYLNLNVGFKTCELLTPEECRLFSASS